MANKTGKRSMILCLFFILLVVGVILAVTLVLLKNEGKI